MCCVKRQILNLKNDRVGVLESDLCNQLINMKNIPE